MHSGSILQSGIRNRRRHVDHPVHPPHDLLNNILKLFRSIKPPIPQHSFSPSFKEDLPCSIYHDLRYLIVIQKLLKDIQTAKAVIQTVSQPQPFL